MKNYYDFKNRTELEGTTFKLCITRPNNLKPSLVRWQYNIDAVTGLPATPESTAVETKYMTIYDHPVIRQSWNSD
jgi:hypothetical protein